MKYLFLLFLPLCSMGQMSGSADKLAVDSLKIRVTILERELQFTKLEVRRLNDISFQPLLNHLSVEDSIHISKIVWWKVMTMLYPGEGMYTTAGNNISFCWMHEWLPRRLRKRFEKANHLGKYRYK